jgi:AcrR family transcriptional regulator
VDRHRRILSAAAEAFHDKGFHGVGVDELGRRAGLRGPTLYRHFPSKDAILATLLNEAMDELLPATVPVLEDPALDLARALHHHVRFAVDNRHLVTLYQREVRSVVDPWRAPFDDRLAQYTAAWERLVARRFPHCPAPVVAAASQACLGLVFSVSSWPHRTRAGVHDVPQLLERLLDDGLSSLDVGHGQPARTAQPELDGNGT